jgi:hypothetical protein
MAGENESVGRASQWLAVTGLVGPVVLAIALNFIAAALRLGDDGRSFSLYALLFVLLEAAALVCGIVGRRSGAGKAGLAIAGVSLVLGLGIAALLAPVSMHMQPAAEQLEEKPAAPMPRQND